MYQLLTNCRLIGKSHLYLTEGAYIENSEGIIVGNDISAYFVYSFLNEYDEYEVEGLNSIEVTFKEGFVSFNDLEIDANYLLLIHDDIVIYFEKLTSGTKEEIINLR